MRLIATVAYDGNVILSTQGNKYAAKAFYEGLMTTKHDLAKRGERAVMADGSLSRWEAEGIVQAARQWRQVDAEADGTLERARQIRRDNPVLYRD